VSRVWQLLVRADGDTKAAQRELKALQKRTRNFGNGMKDVGRALTMGLTLPLVGLGILGVKGLADAERASAQTAAALKSTGNSARTSVAGIETMAMSLRRMSGVDDEIIQKGANVLLTFTKISNAGGKAGGNFDKATEAALNMSVALGTDMKNASLLVGKALNDPIKGVSALRRSGVQLTAQQEKQVKAMVAAGDVAGAQRIILGELETQFGGSAKAAGQTFAGQLSRAKLAVEEMAEAVMRHAMPTITRFAEWVTKLAERFGEMSPKMQKVALVVGLVAAAAGPLLIVLGSMVTAFAAIIPVIAAISLPVIAVVAAIAALAAVFVYAYRTSDTFRETVNAAFAAVVEFVTSAMAQLRSTITVWVRWARAFWNQFGAQITAYTRGVWNAIRGIVSGQLQVLRGAVQTILSLLRGDWSGAWAGIRMSVAGALQMIRTIVSAGGTAIRTALSTAWQAMNDGARTAWNGLKTVIGNALGAIPGLARSAVSSLPGIMADAGRAAGKALADALKAAVNAVLDRVRSISLPKVEVAGKSIGGGSPFAGIPRLAAGGIVSGPTVAMVGEYAGARSNPEVIAPLDKLQAMLGSVGPASVTINAPGADAEAVARKLMFELGGTRLRMGGAF
jgi:phage-related minor tail protein